MENKNPHAITFAGKLKVTEVLDRTVLDIVREAGEIIAGRLDVQPTVEHLKALDMSRMYWRAQATNEQERLERFELLLERLKAEADAFSRKFFGGAEGVSDPRLLIHLPELDSECARCEKRAQYALAQVNQMPELLCEEHAKELPGWTGARVQ